MTISRIMGALAGNGRRDRLFDCLFWGVVVTFSVMVVSAWLQVLSRYLFNFPFGWTEELSRVMMFWFTYLSIGVLVRRRRLMVVDAFVLQLPPRGRLAVSGLIFLASALTLAWLGWLSIELMGLASGQASTALHIPYSLIYLSLPVGLAGGVVYFVAVGAMDLRKAISPTPPVTSTERQTND